MRCNRRKFFYRLGLGVTAASLLIQLIPSNRTEPAGSGSGDLLRLHPPEEAVAAALRSACYDCHSDETRYPWYSRIQPFGWWLESHIQKGRAQINFSRFDGYPRRRQVTKLETIAGSVDDRSMPLASYMWAHPDAVLTEGQRRAIIDWCDAVITEIEGKL